MNKLFCLICLLPIVGYSIKAFAQVDGHNPFLDTLAKRWNIKEKAVVVGYGIQSQPYVKDSITIYVRFGNDYTQYGFKGQFMDSLLLKNRYLTDEDAGMKRIIEDHKITFPPPPASSQ